MKQLLFFFLATSIIFSADAQNALTEKDYQNAESQLGYNTQKFVDRSGVNPSWVAGDKFWYRFLTPTGS